MTTPMWFPLLVSGICSSSRCWVSPLSRKEYVGWSQFKPVAFFEILLLVSQFLYSALGWSAIHYLHAHSGSCSHSVSEQREQNTTSWSTQILVTVYLKQRSPSCPLHVEISQLLCNSCGHTHPELHGHITGPFPLSILLLGFNRSVTVTNPSALVAVLEWL